LEYQAESQPLRPCELQREKAFRDGEDYVPQCSEDGQFRKIQCNKNGVSCWCVDEKGIEVTGSKQSGSSIACLSFCQLQKQRILVSRYINSSATAYIPQCLDSGDFDPIQCDLALEQCWCVDGEGMEIYGTRQKGKPKQCPGQCDIRDRRILHGVGEKTPPQCTTDGEFLPVQCKFVNTTDRMVFDLIHHFNRFPRAFLTFSSFRNLFSEISGYCYCADSLGRELEDTGLEMLLENVYDTVFASLEPVPTFAESSMYRILQRRFLGIQLATTGRFRCPSKCEIEYSTATRFEEDYKPLCEDSGAYKPTQCQLNGECWCVDTRGQEIPGTRRKGQQPICGKEPTCVSERLVSLSRLFYGPVGHFSQDNLFSATQEPQKIVGSSRFCPLSFKDFFVGSRVLSPISGKNSASQLLTFETLLGEAVGGMFPSRNLAQVALQFTNSPKRFQENLFGGMFLKNLVQFNFTGALGPNSKFNLDKYFQQVGMRSGFSELVHQLFQEDPQQKFNLSQSLVDSFGRMVNLQDNQNAIKFLASLLEAPEFFTFLQHVISVPESVTKDLGNVVRILLKSKDCTEETNDIFVPDCTKDGKYKEIQCNRGECWCVDLRGKEIPGSRVQGTHPRCPTMCEKQRASLQLLIRDQPAGSELFVPSCTEEGKFLPVQCHGKNCFCVSSEGIPVPGIGSNSGEPIQCPSDCHLAGGQAFLRSVQQFLLSPTAVTQLSSIYVPQCSLDGQWRPIQCNGPPEQAFEWYQRWITQNSNGNALPFTDLANILLDYKARSQKSFEDFVKILYEAGHQNIFPEFSKYSSFETVPQDLLEGNTLQSSENVLLDPFTFWQLLQGHFNQYPGSYSDFSIPLGHFDLRNCWCVDKKGRLQGSQANVNQVPICLGTCEAAKQEAVQFVNNVEQLIQESNSSHFPFGQSFLMTQVSMLTGEEPWSNFSQLEVTFSETLLAGSDYAIRLAAQSTLRFYRKRFLASPDSAREAVRLAFQPYIPQCDGEGNWEPIQCYESSGHCWCVDEMGRYVSDSLVTRSTQLPQWVDKNGDYANIQKLDSQAWCLNPVSGEVMKESEIDSNGEVRCPSYCSLLKSKALVREMGKGYIPRCDSDREGFSSTQCSEDQESCWCVFDNGQEAPGTRVNGQRPACERPQCPLPYNASYLSNGGVFCNTPTATSKTQQCQVICSPGYQDVFSQSDPLLCDTESLRWLATPPHSQACQRIQPFQSVQIQTQFQLILPPKKTCSPDYSGLLETFQIFILDELKARGLCNIQVNTLENLVSIPVCGDSAVLVQCMAADRLGVNITWQAMLRDVPAASLPDLYDIEKAMAGENLLGRFEELIKSGGFVLHLDNKQFQADTSIRFPGRGDSGTSPKVYLGCKSGFQTVLTTGEVVPNSQGCAVCPPGSSFQNESCIPCPSGFYQDRAGSNFCVKCPLGKFTVSAGAFRADHCITDCQRNEQIERCDENGQYRPSYKDSSTQKSFCADIKGKRLDWTEADGPLTDSQCSVLRRFEKVPASNLMFSTEESETIGTKAFQGDPMSTLQQCIAECEKDESCGFLTMSAMGSETLCELYSARESNYNCSTSGLVHGVWDNSLTTSIASLSCLIKVRSPDKKNSLSVYLKKGQEFTTAGVKTFEKTDFQDVVSGVYSIRVVSAAGTSLTDVHLFCRQVCHQDACCDGFILSQLILDGGSIACSLLSSPGALICNLNDWDGSSTRQQGDICQRTKYKEGRSQYTVRIGDQVLAGASELADNAENPFTSFQRVYLWRDSTMMTRNGWTMCDATVVPTQTKSLLSASTKELFSIVENNQILTEPNRSLPSQKYWLFKHRYSAEEVLVWCLARCVEDEFCLLADVPNNTDTAFFPCTLYPAAQVCNTFINNIPNNCKIVLPQKPRLLYQKIVSLEGSVKNFYTRLPFRKMSGVSVRNKMDMSGKTVSNGFFDCERLCDADPCCSGFGLLNASQGTGSKVLCLTLDSLGIQTCSNEFRSDWQIFNCTSLETEARVHPFGWYQKSSIVPRVCPPVPLPEKQGKVTLDKWQRLDRSSILLDPSISKFDVIHVSRDPSSEFATIRDFCLSVCSKDNLCLVTTLEILSSAIRCIFYPETQSCTLSLQGHHCRILLKEPAAYIYRKQDAFLPTAERNSDPSVHIPSQGTLLGISQVIQVGSKWKSIGQFLGIPYAAPPVGENRFHPPQPFTWTDIWNATTTRASCWQPGDDTSLSSVSEDCLFLNIFVPQNNAGNLPVLVFFHNSIDADDQAKKTVLDGSYLAGVGNLIVVTASYRVGVFGFFSTGSSVANGNWGLLDQEMALKWIQKNIAMFGGDAGQITIGANERGADFISTHLLKRALNPILFKRALLMGGSAFSPAVTLSKEKARAQAAVLARELGCPSTSSAELVSCLRQLPAKALNDAQTKLLAISGPFQYWGPVVDGSYLQESFPAALQRSRPLKMDLLIGSAQQDGLIIRAKAIKRFEESQGRANSKTAFYQALQNSLGGEESNLLIQDAVTWFYSLQHSSTEYASFSRALENATRDHFIICPTIDMAKDWASNGRGNIFMYHVPESSSLSSSSLEYVPDVQLAFGLPFYPQYKNRYMLEEKTLSLAIMQYLSNFIKSGNPNSPYEFSRKRIEGVSPWPMFRADAGGDNYKEFTSSLQNHKGLKKMECSFWDYIKTVKALTSCRREQPVPSRPTKELAMTPISKTTAVKLLEDKEAYSK
ncbi:thyroglobulin, partial [Python bivittatus]|uniref:Thyroglobulin n=1 Tax=Python bivittatus TaxID=176946 RepID=A0A9F5MY64_PYTBI